MKFQNKQNEIFWENISKFDLSGETFRVLCAWVIDVPETHPKRFFPAISIIMKRTGIKHKQQVSRAYGDLVERGILEEIETKGSTQAYKLNPKLLEEGFQPPNFEPVDVSDDEESPEQMEYENSVRPPKLHSAIGKKKSPKKKRPLREHPLLQFVVNNSSAELTDTKLAACYLTSDGRPRVRVNTGGRDVIAPDDLSFVYLNTIEGISDESEIAEYLVKGEDYFTDLKIRAKRGKLQA